MKRAITILALAAAAHVASPAAPMGQEMSEEQMRAWMEAVSPNENHRYESWVDGPDGEMFKHMEIHPTKSG